MYVSNFPVANRLYRNNHDGTFTDVAAELGVTEPVHSFPTWFWDYDNDGLLDLYVSSYEFGVQHEAADYLNQPITCEPDRLYHGLPGGRFEEVGIVTSRWEAEEEAEREQRSQRRYYELNEDGRAALAEALLRYHAVENLFVDAKKPKPSGA